MLYQVTFNNHQSPLKSFETDEAEAKRITVWYLSHFIEGR